MRTFVKSAIILALSAFASTSYGYVEGLNSGAVASSYLNRGNFKHYRIYTGNNDRVIVQLSSLTADLDLYVKKGSKPTFNSYNCRPYKSGTSAESCVINNAPRNSYVYVGVHAYQSGRYGVRATLSRSNNQGSDVRVRNVPFLSQRKAYNCKGRNYLCGFTSANMLSSFYYNTRPTISFTQDMAQSEVGNRCGRMSTSSQHAKSVRNMTNANAVSRFISWDELKRKIRNGTPVSVTLIYKELGKYRCSQWWTKGHSVVVVGFSESRGEWIINDPLCSSGYKRIPSHLFRRAVGKATNSSYYVDAVYIR